MVIGVYSSLDSDDFFKVKCGEDKTKTKACAMWHDAGTKDVSKRQFLVFNKCGKGKKCSDKQCIPEFKLRKIGQSCTYNEDCITGVCNKNCEGVAENGECDYGKYCAPGLHCSYVVNTDTGKTNKKCVKLLGENEKFDIAKGLTKCKAGLFITTNENNENICVKMGTVEDGKWASDSLACKSGLLNEDGLCDTIKTEPTCKDSEITGEWAKGGKMNDNCYSEEDFNGNKKYYYHLYSSSKPKLFEELKKEYEDLDLDKINEEDKYFTTKNGLQNMPSSDSDDPDDVLKYYQSLNALSGDNLKWKVYKKYLAYKYAVELEAAGLIDSDGKVADDKDCEYDFIMKDLSSEYKKIGAFVIAFLVLLF